MKRRVAGSFVGLVLLATTLASVALASDTDQIDLRDTAGRFDVVAVRLHHDADSGRWDTEMARTWTLDDAWDSGYVLVYFDAKGGPEADVYALLRSTGRGLKGALYRDVATGKDPRLGAVTARRPNPKTAQLELALARLEIAEGRTEWFWSVQTLWTSGACPRVCSDLVPDSGSVAQPVEAPVALTPAIDGTRGAPIEASPNPEDVKLPTRERLALRHAATGDRR